MFEHLEVSLDLAVTSASLGTVAPIGRPGRCIVA
jgi:hypothetical protein